MTMRVAPILIVAMLAGCGAAPTKISSIDIVADPQANQSSATELDIVFVYDSASAALLPKTGPDWFAKKWDLLAGLANGVDVINVGLPPGMHWRPALPGRHAKAVAVYSYANYLAPKGQPVGNLTPYRQLTIKLLPDTIVYSGN
jgi:type VI secretion system protein